MIISLAGTLQTSMEPYPVTGKTIYPVLTTKVIIETLPSVQMEAHQQLMGLSGMNTKAKAAMYIVLEHFLGRGTDNDTPPYTDNPDSVDVYFVVNMSNNLDFDPKTQKVYMAGDLESEVTGGNDWSHGIVMTDIGDGYWSYHWRGAAASDTPTHSKL